MVSTRWTLASLALALLTLAGCGSGGSVGVGGGSEYFNDYLGQTPPALGAGNWINSDGVTLNSLKGKVVWLEFGFLH